MILTPARETVGPVPTIDAAIAAHGAWRVLFAAVVALLRGRMRKARPPDTAVLNDRLRADIGLNPLPPAPDWQRHGLAGLQRN
jgi:hypothetical protein